MTSIADIEPWTQRVERTMNGYSDELLRAVAQGLYRPRNQWPREELVERALAALGNPVVLDRRLGEVSPGGRQILGLIAHSRQPCWPVGNLVELLVTLGQKDGLAPIQQLLQTGLLYPVLPDLEAKKRLRGFDSWLGQGAAPYVFAPAIVLQRSMGQDLKLPPGPAAVSALAPIPQEADGLDWPLRLAILWQQVFGAPLRRTQSGDFFKRDLDRLKSDPLLTSASPDALTDLPDVGLYTVALALATGVLEEQAGEITAGAFAGPWSAGLPALLTELWSRLPYVTDWNPERGWQVGGPPGNPYRGALLLALVLVAQLPADAWAAPEEVASWIVDRHPFWSPGMVSARARRGSAEPAGEGDDHGLVRLLLGVAYPLRLLQATRDGAGRTLVRLSPVGRWVLGFREQPGGRQEFPQTLLVQPNLEVLAYRQGLTPELIVLLTRFAAWRTLGAACTLQLEPASVYRALESGLTFDGIVQTLERRGMKPVPPAVLDALRTWSNKRDRLSVWTSAALFEFPTPDELTEALARGLPAVRLTDRLAVVASEDQIDYRHFRLTGTRDYCLPPERCVDMDVDGVTLSIDLARSDLLLDSEVQRFAQPLSGPAPPGRKLYHLTTASIAQGRQSGLTLPALETWFGQRTGLPLSPAARLLFTAADASPTELRRQLILHVPSADLADGLTQWPATRGLIQARLGPTALVVAERDAAALEEQLKELGMRLFHGEG